MGLPYRILSSKYKPQKGTTWFAVDSRAWYKRHVLKNGRAENIGKGGFSAHRATQAHFRGRLFDYLLALKWVMDVQKTSAGLGFQHIGRGGFSAHRAKQAHFRGQAI